MKRAGYDQLDVPGEEGGRKWNGKLVIEKKGGKKRQLLFLTTCVY
jgi:hypothetical protein